MSISDVMQVVGNVVIFQTTPKETHVMEVKIIVKYLKETKNFGLWYPKGNDLSLVADKDADWEGSIDERRSTIGECFYLGEFMVSWLRKKKFITIIVHRKSRIYCSIRMLNSGSLDEVNLAGYTNEV